MIALIAVAALALVALAPSPARAQAGDRALLDRALADAYDIAPAGLDGLRARFADLARRRSRDGHVEAGMALVDAATAAARGDADLAERALKRADHAISLIPSSAATLRAHGLASLVAGSFARRKLDRRSRLGRAAQDFAAAAQTHDAEASRTAWLDAYHRGLALLEMRALDDAEATLRDALAALERTSPAATTAAATTAPGEGSLPASAGEGAAEGATSGEPGEAEAAAQSFAHHGAAGYDAATARVRAAIARAREAQGDLAGAAELLAAAREAAPKDAAVAARYGLLLARMRGEEQAHAPPLLAALSVAGATDVASARTLALRAGAEHISDGDLPAREATAALAELAKPGATPGSPWLAAPGGPLAALAADLATATAAPESLAVRAELRRRAGDAAGAEKDAKAALAKSALCARAHAVLADLARARKDDARAKREDEIAAAFEPATVIVDKEAPAETAARAAEALAAAGRFDEALDEASRALALDATSARAQVARTRALVALQRGGEARAAALALAKRFPDLHDVAVLEARADALAGDAEAAHAAATRALSLEPTDVEAQHILGGGAAPASDAKLPPELAAAAKRLGSTDPIERADAAKALLDDPAGLEVALKALEREPDAFVVGDVALALAERGKVIAVPSLCRAFRAMPPTQMVARARLVRALARLGDPAAIPDILAADQAGTTGDETVGPEGETPARAAVKELMGRLDETAAIRFQRDLVESPSEVTRALAPVLAQSLLEGRLRRAERSASAKLLLFLRLALVGAIAGLGLLRRRMHVKAVELRKLAEAQVERTSRWRAPAAK